VAQTKRSLRAELTAARDSLPQDVRAYADQRILRELVSLPEWGEAAEILCYISMGSEVDTRAIIRAAWDEGRQVYAPRCVASRSMVWHRIESFDGLVRSRFGVFEPQSGAEWDPASPNAGRSLAIVPGLAFDWQGYRLGYGGGYYDRFLAHFPGTSVGVVRTAQLVDDLAALGVVDSHDLPVHRVITG
jgi:5-formyltetrahydrofolate cyclo-ligase